MRVAACCALAVGFYSVYLVADKVRVVTKHNDDKQYVWESMADGSFTVAEDPRGNTLGRGSEITLFLKEEANDMASESTLRGLIKKYSEFVSLRAEPVLFSVSLQRVSLPRHPLAQVTFPIHLRTTTYDSVDVPDEEAIAEDAKKAAAEADSDEVVAEEDKEPAKPKTKKETRKTLGWEVVNDQKAIWQRKNKDISDAEYKVRAVLRAACASLGDDPCAARVLRSLSSRPSPRTSPIR